MRELSLSLPSSKAPGYARIAAALRDAIQKETLQAGELLPSTRALGEKLGFHRHTVMTALDELVAEGWLTAVERQGYRVIETPPTKYFEPVPTKTVSVRKKSRIEIARPIGVGLRMDHGPKDFTYSFQSGMPDLRLFPKEAFRGVLNESVKRSGNRVFDYTDPGGYPPLVEEVRTYLRRLRGVADRAILITHGSQEAIFMAAQLLVPDGSAVGVERLGYRPAWEAIKAAGGKLIPIEIDREGMVPESLETAITKHHVRLIYLTPLHQYPTTVTMPFPRREAIYEIVSRHNVLILEDDYDHEFHYRSQPLPPLAAHDPGEFVMYVSTFSKVLFPSSRIGFLAFPPHLLETFAGFRRIMSRQNDTIVQDAVARFMRSGQFEKHLRKMRRAYEQRRDVLVESLTRCQEKGAPISFQVPDGGMALWLDCGMDSGKLAERLVARKVFVTPEVNFQLTRGKGTHLRLGFANQTERELKEGLKIIGETILDSMG